MLRVLVVILALVTALLVGARLYGAYRWNAGTQELRARLDAARLPVRPQTIDFRELEDLPAPVPGITVPGAGVADRRVGVFGTGRAQST